MRTTLAAMLTAVLLLPVATADARRKPTRSEKRAIAAVFNAPPKCSQVFVSTVNERWATYRFDHRKIDVSPCEQVAADGVAVLRKRRGQWRMVTAGSSFECPVPDVPKRIVKDLRVRCEEIR